MDANSCSSIAGKNFHTAWWIGICGTTLRSYPKGTSSVHDGGVVPTDQWTHIAVTFDGAHRRHYIDGELVATFAETGPLPPSTDEVRIGSDTLWEHSPNGPVDEVRLWNVARTQAQIRETINAPITSATGNPGLVAVWPFENNGNDIIHGHNGTAGGTGAFFAGFGSGPGRVTSATILCIGGSGGRFAVTAKYRTGAPGTPEGQAHVGVNNAGSGILWFFGADNWEVLVRSIAGCALNSRYWVFSTATTNVHYRLEVFDRTGGEQKIYFNYPGPPAPAVTGTSAFATCP